MTRSTGALRWGANFTAVTAGLHFLSLIVGGLNTEAFGLVLFGVFYAGFAYGLMLGWRWLAYVGFIVLLIGTSLAASNIWAFGTVPGWLYAAIAVANLLAIAALFAALWKTPNMQT